MKLPGVEFHLHRQVWLPAQAGSLRPVLGERLVSSKGEGENVPKKDMEEGIPVSQLNTISNFCVFFFLFLKAITSEDGINQAKASILRIMIAHSFSWNCRVYKALPRVEDIPLKLLWSFYDHFSLEKRTSKRFHVLCKVTKLRHKAMFLNVGLSPIPRQPMIQSMHKKHFVHEPYKLKLNS